MAEMTYNEALFDSSNLFAEARMQHLYSGWNIVLEVGDKPLEAYRVFKTKEAAEIIVRGNTDGNETLYDIYPGAVVSVIDDPVSENNGLYHVELTGDERYPYKLVKILMSGDNVSSSITVLQKTDASIEGSSSKINPYIYFVGTDSSLAKQTDVSIFYFNPGIVYDASGGSMFQNSDERLKNVVANIEPNLDELHTIDKVVFNWKQDKSHKNNIGVIAQTVEKLYPELVINNPDSGYKMVNYAGLSVIALAAVDKLYEKVQDLEAEVTRLKNMK